MGTLHKFKNILVYVGHLDAPHHFFENFILVPSSLSVSFSSLYFWMMMVVVLVMMTTTMMMMDDNER